MKAVLRKVKDIYQEGCVTILLNTHRTSPENEKDPLVLKNLINEAEERLHKDYKKRFAWKVLERLNQIAKKLIINVI